jgi:hypothetical protein
MLQKYTLTGRLVIERKNTSINDNIEIFFFTTLNFSLKVFPNFTQFPCHLTIEKQTLINYCKISIAYDAAGLN